MNVKRNFVWVLGGFIVIAFLFCVFEGCKSELQRESGGEYRSTREADIGSRLKSFDEVEWLKARQKKQLSGAHQFAAFHDFQFSDRISESNIHFEHQIVDDAGKHWKPVHYDHGNGIAVADVDGDGLNDIYFQTQIGANQLWRNLGGGKFEDITDEAGVGLDDKISVTASFADIDNDGDADLFVTTVKMGNVLFENVGQGRFKDISKASGLDYVGHSSGAVFFDFNRDGLLDLFLTNVGVYTTDGKGRGGYYLGFADAFKGHLKPERSESSILYQNMGEMKFEDVSQKVGLLDEGWSGDAAFVDLNQDNYPDLYVLNMQGDDHYYENLGGERFVEKTEERFPKTSWGAMGIKFFDYNLDGLMDLFITDMHSDMSEHIGPELEKKKSNMIWSDADLAGGDNNIFGNAFYENKGNGQFVEASDQLGVENYWPWGLSVGDLNADGFADLFITSSMNYPFRYGINSALLNNHGEGFVDSEFILGIEPRPGWRIEKEWFTLDCSGADKSHPDCIGRTGTITIVGTVGTRSSVIFDLDDDGDLDIVTNEFNDKPQVLISNLSEKKDIHFIKIKLIGSISNRDGLGATVKVHADAKVYTQYHDGKSGYLSQSSTPLYFGLGESKAVDKIEVRWPSGKNQVISKDIPVNTLFQINEPGE